MGEQRNNIELSELSVCGPRREKNVPFDMCTANQPVHSCRLVAASLFTGRNFAFAIQNAPSDDSDQTARMRSLI